MDSTLWLTLSLLGLGLAAGLVYRFFHGRGHKVVGNECINLEKLAVSKMAIRLPRLARLPPWSSSPLSIVANAQVLEERLQSWNTAMAMFCL